MQNERNACLCKALQNMQFQARFSYFILLYIMTTLTDSEGKVLTCTNELIETILLQLNSSSNCYTTGDDDIIFIKIGFNKVLLLDYTYHINGTIFQNYNINENAINENGLEFILNNTSNENT